MSHKIRAITIDAIIIRANKILLIKRGNEPFKDYWALPGGYIEWDEEAEETVRKEVKEEVGLDVTKMTLLNAYTKPERDPEQKITLAYIVETKDTPHAGDDAKAYQWFALDNLPVQLAFDHDKIIKDYLKTKQNN